MNYVNFFNHSLYVPDVLHRRYDFDTPERIEIIQRVCVAAMPFIALIPVVNKPLSTIMNGSRIFSQLGDAIVAEDGRNWIQCGRKAGELSLSILSFAGIFYSFTMGTAITTGADIIQGTVKIFQAGQTDRPQEILQVFGSSLYLGFMVTGQLELMLAFVLIQGAVSLYQAKEDIHKQRYIEAFAKAAMGGVRVFQAKHYVDMIKQRNLLFSMSKYRGLIEKVLRARQAGHLIHHPLSSLQKRIEEKDVILFDENGDAHHFGSHLPGAGGAIVKGENIVCREKMEDGRMIFEIDFKVNHAFRKDLEASIAQLRKYNTQEARAVLSLAGSHAKGISVKTGSFFQQDDWGVGQAEQISIDGLGTILIGSEPIITNLYDRVVIRMDASRTLFDLHEMLALIDLDRAICLSSQEDIERLKIGHLFRTFFPREATPFERTKEFFDLPLDLLKAKMIELAPDMDNIYKTYFSNMQAEPLFDGRIRYRITGLSQAAYEAGARAMTAAVMGVYTDEELFARTASMLKMGMIAHETREENEFDANGLCSGFDYVTGGADSVFTQMITQKNCREQRSFDELEYCSKVRMLISLDALEMGTYQYHTDNFGMRVYENDDWWFWEEKYRERENILEFTRREQTSSSFNEGHEIMFKERVAPTFFKGLIVSDEETKSALIEYLSNHGLVENGAVLNTPIDRFIRVGTQATEELVS